MTDSVKNEEDTGDAGAQCCCASGRGTGDVSVPALKKGASKALRDDIAALMAEVPGGFFDMGARKPRYPADFEGPQRKVFVSPFRITRISVTNALYARFVEESGYRTVAETEGWSYVFHMFLEKPDDYPNSPAGTPWWRQVHGATWAAPEGPGTSFEGRENHPAIHLAWYDALAFCDFTGVRLPTEAEWEKAARGGLSRKKFPWGNQLEPESGHRHNVWQGNFPVINTQDDGYAGTCPADQYQPNGYGLHNMTGNVWEWCADWFGKPEESRLPPRDPKGPETGEEKVVKGGSHLCHASYCERYHVHSRTKNTPDSSTGHMGFRVVADA